LHLQHDRPGAFAADRRNEEPRLLPSESGDDLLRPRPRLVLEHQVGLVEDQPARLVQHRRVVLAQLGLDRADLLDRFGLHARLHRRDVHQVQQQPRALHVAQEQAAQPGAVGGALDQSGDVGDHEAAAGFDADHAQVRVQGGERIVGDLRRGRGHGADQGALAGVGEAEQADVGQQLELQSQQPLLALLARRELPRRAVGRALEVHVAKAALAAPGHEQAVAVAGHVAADLVGGDVDDLGADRADDRGVLAALAVALLAHAVLATLGAEPLLVAEVDQGVEVLRRLQPHAAAVAAVATVRPAERDELLAPETDAAVAAVSGGDGDFGFVDEFHWIGIGDWDWGLGRAKTRTWGVYRRMRSCGCESRIPNPESSPGKQETPPKRGLSSSRCRASQPAATTLTVRRFFGPLVANSTLPSTSANRVWSRPRPTPEPGWNWVPRWRTMMLPASIAWPP